MGVLAAGVFVAGVNEQNWRSVDVAAVAQVGSGGLATRYEVTAGKSTSNFGF